MTTGRKTTLALALAATLVFSGCIGTGEDGELSFLDAGDDATGTVRIAMDARNVSEAGLSHVGMKLDGIFLHDAETPLPDGYHAIDVQTAHADIVTDGASLSAVVANGDVPAGEYDQLMLRLAGIDVQAGGSSGDGHAHEHGDGGHAHDDAAGQDQTAGAIESVDIPVNVSFAVEADASHQVKITLDAEESTSAVGDFEPVLDIVVTRGGETIAEARAGPEAPDTPPPAARMSVFAPNGDQLYKPAFTVEQNVFVNSKATAIRPGEDVRFSGTESEAVAQGASIAGYAWDFDDGTSATGPTAVHAFEGQGVFEVQLTVTDSMGVSSSHVIRMVVLQAAWTTTAVEESFEDGPGDWQTSAAGSLTPAGQVQTTWALDGGGHNSSTAWHVGHHAAHPKEEGAPPEVTSSYPGYTSNAEATLTSPAFEIPANWTSAGFSVFVGGQSETGFDPLTITYSIDGGPGGTVATVDNAQGWVQFEDLKALSDAIGKTVTFKFTFTSDANSEQGPGFYVDDLVIGGVDLPLQKAHLLEQSAHDGHNHSH